MSASMLKIAENIFGSIGKYVRNFVPKIEPPLQSDSSAEEIEEYQREALKRVLERAAKTPFYKSLFLRKGINVKNVESINDLSSISLTDRYLRLYRPNMRNPYCRFFFSQATSGTGGNPVKVDISLKQLLNVLPIHQRNIEDFGQFNKGLVIIHRGSPSYYLALLNSLIENKVEFADYRSLAEQTSKIRNKDCLIGYPTALIRFAQHLKNCIEARSIKLIVYAAEPLTERGREILLETFTNAQIRSIYGSIETYGPIGFTCKNGTFHLNPDFAILEQDHEHNAIVTCLDKDRGTILLRYAGLKDKIWFTSCSCKLKFPAFILKGTFRHIDGERIANALYGSKAFSNGIIGPYFDFQVIDDFKENKKVVKIQLELNKAQSNLKSITEELEHIIIYGNKKVPPSKPLQDLKDMLKFDFTFHESWRQSTIKSPGLRRQY